LEVLRMYFVEIIRVFVTDGLVYCISEGVK
jgi:hypothetical protein